MINIDTIARLLIELQIPFNYRVEAFKKEIEVISNERIKPFLVSHYTDGRKMIITNNSEAVEPKDLMHSLNRLFVDAC